MIHETIKNGLETIQKSLPKKEFQGKKVLITGGAGFIGSWITDLLVINKAEVTIIDDFSTGLSENIDHLVGKPNLKLIKKDITKISLKEVGEHDLILNLASRPTPDDYQLNPLQTLRISSIGTEVVLEAARKYDAKILTASTSEIYGDTQVIPTPETYWGNVNPTGPRSCYDEGKRYGEALVTAYRRQYGLQTVIIRIFNTYGPRLRAEGTYGRALSRFIDQALTGQPITVYGTGKQTRSFTYITDTAKGILQATIAPKAIGETINIGNIQETTILQLAQTIKTLTKSTSKITFKPLPQDDPKRRAPDITKAKQILGWIPQIDLETGLRKTIEWFQEQHKG
ncbi:MAG: GDP-mannose 4,6-dehydratase [Thaumarchaeota archaeon]|nr:GDP-mannose 4,6-dehydratase [Nitrososphaerota archaeon]MCL5318554.1 GDP-mannose 4,6-dehydratase [Nitrososphaerota archaeon]